ncbi:MAG TPA: right-handed parallel beta-helix repeat-containing protein [Polyangia bacterium]|nr:right-handed parallel beta-helix repeat-containing protein [Polyangia bacterium]
MRCGSIVAVVFVVAVPVARADTLSVGPGKTYAAPCAAFAAAHDGDLVEIDAASSYAGDVCAIAPSHLTIRGVNGRAHVDAAGKNSGGKAIWVIQGADTTVENVELSGASVADKNGAGIRQEGAGLTVRGCFFHDNEDGILTAGGGEILIEGSEFARNGAGDGYSHNMYIGHEKKFTLRGSYSHHAKIGHLVKSRADENDILYNRLMDEADGTSSYAIDLPNGGTSIVVGNLIQQGPMTDNAVILAYAEEGATNTKADLYVVNNTFVNDRGSGTFLHLATGAAPAVVRNNIFLGGGTVIDQAGATMQANFTTGDPLLVDRAGFDYHLRAGSPCVNAGVDPGAAGATSLAPTLEYVHPEMTAPRPVVGALDIGAYELGTGGSGGMAGTDAAAGSMPDASSSNPPSSSGGCSCAAAPLSSGGDAALGWLVLALGALICRTSRVR